MSEFKKKLKSLFLVFISFIQLILPLVVIADHSINHQEEEHVAEEGEETDDSLNKEESDDEKTANEDLSESEDLEESEKSENEDLEDSEDLEEKEEESNEEEELEETESDTEIDDEPEEPKEELSFQSVQPIEKFEEGSLGKESLTKEDKEIEGLLPGEVLHKASIHELDEKENTWTAEVEIKSRAKIEVDTIDVVFVVERSKHLEDQKEKIKEAFEKLLEENIGLRITVVSYAGPGEEMLKIEHQFSRDTETLTEAIDKIDKEDGSNIQARILQGYELLKGSSADQKHLLLISEGMPTYSYEPENWSELVDLEDYEEARAEIYDGNFDEERVLGDGSNVDERTDEELESFLYVNHADAALQAADIVKENVDSLLTLAFDVDTEASDFLQEVSSDEKGYRFEDIEEVVSEISSERISLPALKDAKLFGEVNEDFVLVEDTVEVDEQVYEVEYSKENDEQEFSLEIPTDDKESEEIQKTTISYQIELDEEVENEDIEREVMDELFLEYVGVEDVKQRMDIEFSEVKIEKTEMQAVMNTEESGLDFFDDRTYEDYDGEYTLQNILKNYAVFSFGNVYSSHIHGNVSIQGNLDGPIDNNKQINTFNNTYPEEESPDKNSIPSYIQGSVTNFKPSGKHLNNQYLGYKNNTNIIVKEGKTYKVNDIKKYFNSDRSDIPNLPKLGLYHSDKFIDWDEAKEAIKNDSKKIAIDSANKKISEDDKRDDGENSYTGKIYIEIKEGESYSISASLLKELDVIVLDRYTDKEKSTSTIINIINDPDEDITSIELPDIFFEKFTHGNAATSDPDPTINKKKSIIWNVVDEEITNVKTKCMGDTPACSGSGSEGFGHLVAPHADFESKKGQYHGDVIVKSMDSDSTHHYLESDIPDLVPAPEQVLPQTGGMGDLVYVVVGSVFILSSAYFYKKKIIIE